VYRRSPLTRLPARAPLFAAVISSRIRISSCRPVVLADVVNDGCASRPSRPPTACGGPPPPVERGFPSFLPTFSSKSGKKTKTTTFLLGPSSPLARAVRLWHGDESSPSQTSTFPPPSSPLLAFPPPLDGRVTSATTAVADGGPRARVPFDLPTRDGARSSSPVFFVPYPSRANGVGRRARVFAYAWVATAEEGWKRARPPSPATRSPVCVCSVAANVCGWRAGALNSSD